MGVLEDLEEKVWAKMVAEGTNTLEQVAFFRAQKKHLEEAEVCKIMIANRMWEHDLTCPARTVYLCNAAALDQVRNGLVHTPSTSPLNKLDCLPSPVEKSQLPATCRNLQKLKIYVRNSQFASVGQGSVRAGY